MGSKFMSAVKCFIKRPVDSTRLMLGSYEPRAVEAIKTHCPGVEIESFGYYVGLFMSGIFVFACVMAYILFYVLKVIYYAP